MCVQPDFEDTEAGWIGCSGDGGARGLFTVALPFEVTTSAWCAGFNAVFKTHMFDKSIQACEQFIPLYENRQKVSTGQQNKWGELHNGELTK